MTPTGGSASALRSGISYQYNANGQITSITENNKTHSYEYDGLGRLARENDEDRSVTICYNYDSNGNILSKVEYPYTTGALTSATRTVPYTYAVSWGDQLLTYNNGSSILYDQIGNPLSYNGYTFTWQKGRQLASATKDGETFNFIYNADGQRTWKVGSTTGAQYTYASGLLVSMTDGTNTLNFTYDPDGIALGVNLNGTDYYYLYNAQGDVIALYDSAGTVVTEYKYDSWGKLLSTTGSAANTIGLLNPLRYRGYFYDTDLGFYLLETRYYDPETGRFINADGVLDNRNVSTYNLFSYGANDPINTVDLDGNFPVAFVAGAIIGAVSGALSAYAKNKGKKHVKGAVIKGAVVGAITGGITGAFGGLAGNVVKAYKAYRAVKALAVVSTNIDGAVTSYAGARANRAKATTRNRTATIKTVEKRKAGGKGKTSIKVVSKTISYSYMGIDWQRNRKEVIEDRYAALGGAVGGALSAGISIAAVGVFSDVATQKIDVVAEFGFNLMANTNTSAFDAIVSNGTFKLFH